MQPLLLLFLISTAGLAQNWSGFLVDSRCWASFENNASGDSTTVNRDMDMGVRYCSPTAHTRRFAVVLYDWSRIKLDPDGNLRAAQIVEHGNTRALIYVSVRGVPNKKTIKVISISPLQVTAKR